MPEPAYAVVDLRCDIAKLKDVEAIPNLRIEFDLERTEDPNVVLIHAFADAGAQAAAATMGCTVTVVKSAEDYQEQVMAAYRALSMEPDDGGSAIG
jgi:hypothetical protein